MNSHDQTADHQKIQCQRHALSSELFLVLFHCCVIHASCSVCCLTWLHVSQLITESCVQMMLQIITSLVIIVTITNHSQRFTNYICQSLMLQLPKWLRLFQLKVYKQKLHLLVCVVSIQIFTKTCLKLDQIKSALCQLVLTSQ